MKPFNRHVLVKPIVKKKKEEATLVVLPSDYKQPESAYMFAEVLDLSDDCNISLNIGDKIVFEKRTLQKIEIDSEIYYLILQNYIYGRF
jgi:co-chaperonin GroES (HSP10)|tara:strand:+ start:521 stop:787 length:267 start_codon:yes stop_codon:yes gene_type:complete